MKIIVPLFYFFCLPCLQGIAQNGQSVLVVDVNIQESALTDYLLEISRENPYQRLDRKEVNNNSRTVFIYNDSIPFWATIDLKNKKDSSISNASMFLVTKDTIRILFNTTEPPAIVSGGENEFIDRNRYLLFDLPGGIYVSEYREKIRKTYQYQTTSGYLYPRVNEYLNNSRKILQKYGKYYFVLQQLNEKKEYFPLNFLDTCLSSFDNSLHSTKHYKDLVSYIAQEKQLLPGKKIPLFDIQGTDTKIASLEKIYKSKQYLYIDFWASWCVPCRDDMKKLKEVHANLDTSLIKVISISIDEERQRWVEANTIEKLPWDSYIDYSGKASKLLNISFIPQGFIIDNQGRIIDRLVRVEGFKNFIQKNQYNKK